MPGGAVKHTNVWNEWQGVKRKNGFDLHARWGWV